MELKTKKVEKEKKLKMKMDMLRSISKQSWESVLKKKKKKKKKATEGRVCGEPLRSLHSACSESVRRVDADAVVLQVANLFAKDEIDEIQQNLVPVMKREMPKRPPTSENLYDYFLSRAKNNLHVVLCFSPVSVKLEQVATVLVARGRIASLLPLVNKVENINHGQIWSCPSIAL